MIIYADTSALAAVYLRDQVDHQNVSAIIYDGLTPVVTSALCDVEIASAIARAERDGVIDGARTHALMSQYRADTSDEGPVGVIPLDVETLALAQQDVIAVPVRTLDAIHLAACARFGVSVDDEVRLLTRDHRQNAAAQELGIALVES